MGWRSATVTETRPLNSLRSGTAWRVLGCPMNNKELLVTKLLRTPLFQRKTGRLLLKVSANGLVVRSQLLPLSKPSRNVILMAMVHFLLVRPKHASKLMPRYSNLLLKEDGEQL